MAQTETKPGAPVAKDAEARRSPVRKLHDAIAAEENGHGPAGDDGGSSAATATRKRSSSSGGQRRSGSRPSSGKGRPGPGGGKGRASGAGKQGDPSAAGAGRKRSAGRTGGKPSVATAAKDEAGRAAGKAASKASQATGHPAGKLFESTSLIGTAGRKTLAAVARRSARRAAGTLASKAIPAGAHAAKKVAGWAGGASGESILARARTLPIQRAVDVAVPLEVAWDEWMQFNYFPEGAHRVKDVHRDGDHLVGRVASPARDEWEAEIIDERIDESFAWHSIDGSDCAGLVTFHRLSDRLTRIELNLDVRPVGMAEALALTLHLADRRAEADLRRFKAHVELINPDTYEESGQ
jgi:uncharacterized membrane protein